MLSKRLNFEFSWSIRWVLTLIVLLATLPAMAIIATIGFEATQHAEQDAREAILNLARSIAKMHREQAGEAKLLLNTLEQLPQVTHFDFEACNEIFTHHIQIHPELSNIFLTDASGRVVASGLPAFLGVDLSDRDYYQSVVANRTLSASGYAIGRASAKQIQVFAIPLLDSGGRMTGMLGMSFLTKQFGDYLAGLSLPSYMRVTFMDFNGLRLFSYPESPAFLIGQPSPMNWPIIKAFPQDEGTYRGKRNDNADVLLALSKVRLSPDEQPYLYVVTSAGTREVFKEARYLFKRNIVLLLLAAALALFVSHLIGKKILLRDMDGLISAARKLGEGDLSARAESGRGCREMRNLAETFNEMGQALENRRNELQETARALSKMRNMLNNILESMPSAVIGLDRQKVITHWNQGAEHLSGTSAGSALGKPLHEVFPWLAGQVDHEEKKPRAATPLRLERRVFPEGNETRFVDILAYPLVANGVEGAVVRVDDVTRRVELETIMIQTEKISSMGCLAGGMAHEINNPLAGILQSIQNIQRRMSPGLEANIRAAEAVGTTLEAVVSYLQNREILNFLDSIKQSGERAAKIVKNMLGFIRKSNSAHIPVHLPELVDRAIEIAGTDYNLKKKYDFRKIEIIRKYDPNIPPVYCSPSDIEQVVYNLLANAAQAMGSVDSPPEPPRMTLRIYEEGLFGVLEVEDNGPGMNEDVRKRVFEPLFTTKEPGEGTGLGLAVTYFIVVNSYGGSIQVESEKGKGSRFIISLPLGPRN